MHKVYAIVQHSQDFLRYNTDDWLVTAGAIGSDLLIAFTAISNREEHLVSGDNTRLTGPSLLSRQRSSA